MDMMRFNDFYLRLYKGDAKQDGLTDHTGRFLHPLAGSGKFGRERSVLRILRSRDHQEPAEKIKRWAIKNGWLPKTAERLEVLAEKAFALRSKPKLDNPEHAEQNYQRWTDAAKSA